VVTEAGEQLLQMATPALALLDERRCTVVELHVCTHAANVIFPRSGSSHSLCLMLRSCSLARRFGWGSGDYRGCSARSASRTGIA
jgi:hypothetical protein